MFLKMKLVFLELFAFFSVNIYFGFALSRQNEVNEDLLLKYDVFESIRKSEEPMHTCGSSNLLSVLLEMLSEANLEKCVEDMNYVLESLLSPSTEHLSPIVSAMEMLDSFGKPESGILEGNRNWLGHYDECVGTQVPPKENSNVGGFRGKYCILEVPPNFLLVPKPLSIGVCLPGSCNVTKINFNLPRQDNLNGTLLDEGKLLESAFSNMTLTCKATSKELTTGAISVICLLSVLALPAVIGSFISVLEYYKKEKISEDTECDSISHDKWKPFFNCFCIFTNGEKILNTDNSEGHLLFIHGIRVLSLNWIILFHTFIYQIPVIGNTNEVIKTYCRWSLITNSDFSVDSFFVLSAFLVGYQFFRKAEKTNGKTSWIHFYAHRYIRLTPVYMIVVAFFATIYPLLGSGPFWPDYDVDPSCKDYWWWNMLYINNFLPSIDECMGWCWYLGADMQFYIISPLFLITLWRCPKVGYSLLGLSFFITFLLNFGLTYEYYIPGLGSRNDTISAKEMEYRMPGSRDIIYVQPYTRIGPYLVGLLLAHYVYRSNRSHSLSLNWITLSLGWIIASGALLACTFGYFHQDLTTVEASFYNSLSRTVFALGLGWVLLVCFIGQGGIVNSILSWKVWIPLSRLSYCAYLVHPILLSAYFESIREPTIYNTPNLIIEYFAFLMISYPVAFVTSLLFEVPVRRLESFIRNKLASRRTGYISL